MEAVKWGELLNEEWVKRKADELHQRKTAKPDGVVSGYVG